MKLHLVLLLLFHWVQALEHLKGHLVAPVSLGVRKHNVLVIRFFTNGSINAHQLAMKQNNNNDNSDNSTEAGNEFTGNCILFLLATLIFLFLK